MEVNRMTKKLRFTVELKAQVHDSPKEVGQGESYERACRLAQCIAADEKSLLEMYKVVFFDLLFGDFYNDELRIKSKAKTEGELILPVSFKMQSQDSSFFTQLFSESQKDDGNEDRDNVLNLIYSQFGNPEITKVIFESFENTDDSPK